MQGYIKITTVKATQMIQDIVFLKNWVFFRAGKTVGRELADERCTQGEIQGQRVVWTQLSITFWAFMMVRDQNQNHACTLSVLLHAQKHLKAQNKKQKSENKPHPTLHSVLVLPNQHFNTEFTIKIKATNPDRHGHGAS